eukprot:6046480-Pleurochrysis_carterae.AAC.1
MLSRIPLRLRPRGRQSAARAPVTEQARLGCGVGVGRRRRHAVAATAGSRASHRARRQRPSLGVDTIDLSSPQTIRVAQSMTQDKAAIRIQPGSTALACSARPPQCRSPRLPRSQPEASAQQARGQELCRALRHTQTANRRLRQRSLAPVGACRSEQAAAMGRRAPPRSPRIEPPRPGPHAACSTQRAESQRSSKHRLSSKARGNRARNR